MELLNPDWNKVWAVDIEGNGLESSVTKVHIVCAYNCGTGEEFESTSYEETSEWFTERLAEGAYFAGHNFLAYDAPTLNRLLGTAIPVARCIDTLVLSWLYSPNLDGGHSLEAYGQRLGHKKTGLDITDWSELTPLMAERCRGDAKLTAKVYKVLVKRLAAIGFSEQSVYIQHNIRVILEKQRKRGFSFNAPAATKLYTYLRKRCQEIEDSIHVTFPPELKEVKRGPFKLLKSGEETSYLKAYRARYPLVRVENGEYICYDLIPFNLGSPAQRTEKLLSLGWVPTEFTPKGSPKMTESQLVELLETVNAPGLKDLIKWLSFNGRANMLNGWLTCYNHNTRCIHGNLWVASTLRFRHDNPNTANIPRVRVDKKTKKPVLGEDGLFTYEARDCWTVSDPSTRTLVGFDAKGLEFRMLAHEIDDPKFTEQVVEGDIHTFMQEVYEVDDRDNAKTISYAIIYGGQDPKIGSIVGGGKKDGERIRGNAFRNLPGLKAVTDRAYSEFNSGRIKLVDGSYVICTSRHAALNYKLQGSGARVMALAAIYFDRAVKRCKLDAWKVGDIHDEWQWDCLTEHADKLIELGLQAFVDAGNELGLNVKIEGNAKKGLTWAMTH